MAGEFEQKGSFLCKDGKARARTDFHSNKKLCFVATDKEFLMGLLVELASMDECYFVKLTANPRDGMYLGRCFFTSDELVGEHWARYKNHPKVMCNVQDDDFTTKYREKVKSYG